MQVGFSLCLPLLLINFPQEQEPSHKQNNQTEDAHASRSGEKGDDSHQSRPNDRGELAQQIEEAEELRREFLVNESGLIGARQSLDTTLEKPDANG